MVTTGILTILGKTKEEIEKTDELEQINLAYLSCITFSNGDISEVELQNQLDKVFKNNGSKVLGPHDDGILLKIIKTNRMYLISDGKVQDISDENIDTQAMGMYIETPTILQGNGEDNNSFKINCIEDFIVYANNPLNYQGTITLERDLDFKSATSYNDFTTTDFGDINENGKIENLLTELTTGKGFKPINLYYCYESRELVIDGKSHTLKNLYINRNGYVGIFSELNDSHQRTTLKNLAITGDITSIDGSAGALIGRQYGTNLCLYKIYNFANVTGYNCAAGFVGICQGNASVDPTFDINFCYNRGTVTSNGMSSGLIGKHNWESYSQKIKILNSFNEGTIYGKQSSGLVGNIGNYYSPTLNIRNSYSLCEIKNVVEIGGIFFSSLSKGGGKCNVTLKNVFSLNKVENITNKMMGVTTSMLEGTTFSPSYVYYPNTFASATNDDDKYTGTKAMSPLDMKKQDFVNALNDNIISLNDEGFAKWFLGENGTPTLDFNTIWNGTEWVQSL